MAVATIPRQPITRASAWVAADLAGQPPALDFGAPELSNAIRQELDHGRGFVVVRDTPTDDDGEAFVALGRTLGPTLPQNRFGDTLYLVRDERTDGTYGGVRGSKTSEALIFHTDAASGFANSSPA